MQYNYYYIKFTLQFSISSRFYEYLFRDDIYKNIGKLKINFEYEIIIE